MIELLFASAVFGFSLGFSQEMAKDLRRMLRRHRRPSRMGPPKGSYGPRQPAPGIRRVYYDMPSTIAECGGPCTFGGPELCDCGALWRDVPISFDEGPTARTTSSPGPTTPKPDIVPKPQFPSPRKIREDFLP